jgi:hypothetical protein
MKAIILGFHWFTSKHIPLPELMGMLDHNRGDLVKMGRHERLLATYEGNDAYYGLILTPKDRKTMTLLEKNATGKWAALLSHFKANQQRTEFNFFYVRKKPREGSHNGIYLAAEESCGSFTFCRHVKNISDDVGGQRFDMERQNGNIKRRNIKNARKEYQFRFEFRMSRDTWETILKNHAFKNLTYEVAIPKISKNFGTPPSGINCERVSIAFDQKVISNEGVIAWVRNLLATENPQRLDARIELESDHFETIHLLAPNQEKCGLYELD